MSQYRRIVSYLYQYIDKEKGQNIGYVRVEQKGNQCRIKVQMKAVVMKSAPEVWLFKQNNMGIEYVAAGKVTIFSGSIGCKLNTFADNVCQSGHPVNEFDGVLLYISDKEYYATTWSNEEIYLGEIVPFDLKKNRADESVPEESFIHSMPETQISTLDKELEKEVSELAEQEYARNMLNEVSDSDKEIIQKSEEKIEIEEQEKIEIKEQEETRISETDNEEADNKEADSRDKEMQIQSICGTCPFKRKDIDYGQRMLLAFPVMYPFTCGKIKESVRIEPKDIGCLPIQQWALSNNRFLLHGYYCYKHLLFIKLKNDNYAIGVPGVYSSKSEDTAVDFSFSDFQSIGIEEAKQGAFGYWLHYL